MEEKIMEILGGICGVGPEEITPDLELFEEGLLDSFGTIQLLMELEDAFGVTLAVEELGREQISTPEKIVRLIREVQP